MYENSNRQQPHPLRNLTAEQFMALGGNAVVYVKHVTGREVGELAPAGTVADSENYHLVVSADGQPLMLADSEETLTDWLAERNFGIVTLH